MIVIHLYTGITKDKFLTFMSTQNVKSMSKQNKVLLLEKYSVVYFPAITEKVAAEAEVLFVGPLSAPRERERIQDKEPVDCRCTTPWQHAPPSR